MARLQILELPEGSSDDRPPFILVIDQVDDEESERLVDSQQSIEGVAKATGAKAVAVFHGMTIDIPANDTTAYLGEFDEALTRVRAVLDDPSVIDWRQRIRAAIDQGEEH